MITLTMLHPPRLRTSLGRAMLIRKAIQRLSAALISSLTLTAWATQPGHETEQQYQDRLKETGAGEVSSMPKTDSADGGRPQGQSVLPRVVVDKSGNKATVIPARLLNGTVVGELVMGQSTLNEALEILPPYPGDRPKKSHGAKSSWIPDEIGEVLDGNIYNYNPAFSGLILGFDRKKKLTFFLSNIPKGEEEVISRKLDSLVKLAELHRDINAEGVGAFTRHGKLIDCVTIYTDYQLHWLGTDKERLRSCNEDVNASKYEKGIACLREVIKGAPNSWSAHYSLGLAYVWSGDERGAKEQLETLERLKQIGPAMNLLEVMRRDRPEWIAFSIEDERKKIEKIEPSGLLVDIVYFYTCPTE